MTSQIKLDQLADRIEKAYRLRHPNWQSTGLTPGVWSTAAARLNATSRGLRSVPIDPELFVAVQNYKSFRRDPWTELAQENSANLYRQAVRRLINQLKAELREELRWSIRFMGSGGSLDNLLTTPRSKASPLTALCMFIQHNRFDLVGQVKAAAEQQHQACPLYRFACKQTIPASLYPNPNGEVLVACGAHSQENSFAWN